MEKKKMDNGTKICIMVMVCAIIGFLVAYFITNSQNDNYTNTYKNNTNTLYSNNIIKTNNTSNTSVERKKVTIIDFSTMAKEEIQEWCKTNNIKSIFTEEYSESIGKNGFIRQSIQNGDFVYEGGSVNIVYSLGKAPTLGEKNALKKANSYLSYSSFSYKSLIEQLEFEGFSNEESVYAVDNCGANWNEQCAKKAKSYMSYSSFSRTGLIEQLEFEGFTHEQAEYGAKSVGY
jgi:hypothetical protein